MGYFKVTWQVEVEADNHLEAARKGMAARLDPKAVDHHYVVDDGYTLAEIDLSAG